MTVFLRRGTETFRWDIARSSQRPPNLAPPRWALVESLWDFLSLTPLEGSEADASSALAVPEDWIDVTLAGLRSVRIPRSSATTHCEVAAESRGTSLCLVVPDHTRPGPWCSVLPELLERVAAETDYDTLTLLVATGTHPPIASEQALSHLDSLTETSRLAWSVEQNSDGGFVRHRPVGETGRGTPISLHPTYLDADVRILFGEMSYHYFAGFGGGPKLVFPGLGEPEGARRNHLLALVAEGEKSSWQRNCRVGELADNPVHLDLLEAARSHPPDWVVTAVPVPTLDADPSVPPPPRVEIVQGTFPESYFLAAETFDATHRVEFTQRPDNLIVDAGGAPRDDTFLQAHKSLQAARNFVRSGGRILLVASCADGWGSADLAARASESDASVTESSASTIPSPSPSSMHRQTLVALLDVLSHCRVGLWSELLPAEVRSLGMIPLGSEDEARAWVADSGRWGWLPRAERFRPAEGWLGGA